jgi:hypothetical protein
MSVENGIDFGMVTSGFKELVPNFAIRDAGDDQSRLPTSSTCVNLLKVWSDDCRCPSLHPLIDQLYFVPL